MAVHRTGLALGVLTVAAAVAWGNFGSILFALYFLYVRPLHTRLSPTLIAFMVVYSVLQMLATIAVNIAGSADDELGHKLFIVNQVAVEAAGIFPAWNHRITEFCASMVPHVLIIILGFAARPALLKARPEGDVRDRKLLAAVALIAAATSVINPTLLAVPFFALAILLPFACFTKKESSVAFVRTIGVIAIVLASTYLIVISLANNAVIHSNLTLPAWVGFPDFRTRSWEQNLRAGLQVFFAMCLAFVGKLLLCYQDMLLTPERSTLLRPRPSPETTVLSVIEERAQWLGHKFMYYLLCVPLLPLVAIAADAAVFSSALALVLLVHLSIGLLAPIRIFSKLIPLFAVLVVPIIVSQYIASSQSLMQNTSIHNSLPKWVLSTQTLWLQIVETGCSYVVFALLAVAYYAHTQREEDTMSPLMRSLAVDHGVYDPIDLDKDLGKKRKKGLQTLMAIGPPGPGGISPPIDIRKVFTKMVGREPLESEEESLKEIRDFEQHMYIEQAKINRMGICEYFFVIQLKILAKQCLVPLALLFTYVAATLNTHLDVVHGIILILFIGFLLFPNAARRGWSFVVFYLITLIMLLTAMTYVLHGDPSVLETLGTDVTQTVGIVGWSSPWATLSLYLALWLCALVRVALRAEYTSIRDMLGVYQFNKLTDSLIFQRWWHLMTMAIAAVVFVIIGLFLTKAFIVAIFLVLFLWVCIFTAYQFSHRVLSALWMLATVYSACAMFLVSLYQFPALKKMADEWMSNLEVCHSESDPLWCQTQIGVVPQTDANLTFFLLPWFVALAVSVLHVKTNVERRKMDGENFNATVDSEPMPYSKKSKHTDQRYYRGIWNGMHLIHRAVSSCVSLVLFCGEPLYWLSLLTASLLNSTVLSMVYMLAFAARAHPVLVVFYAVVQILAVYLYQFSFVPGITATVGNIQIAEVLGLVKSTERTVATVLRGPLVAFLGALLFGFARVEAKHKREHFSTSEGIIIEESEHEEDDTASPLSATGDSEHLDHRLSSKALQRAHYSGAELYGTIRDIRNIVGSYFQRWSTFAKEELPYYFGYEAVIFLLLLTMSFCIRTIEAVFIFFPLLFTVFGGRDRFYRSFVVRVSIFVVAVLVMLAELFARLNNRRDLWVRSPTTPIDDFANLDCPYWGLRGNLPLLWAEFFILAVLHILQSSTKHTRRWRYALLEQYDGCITIREYLDKNSLDDLQGYDSETLERHLPPEPEDACGTTITKVLSVIFCTFPVTALLSFVCGANSSSALHSLLLFAAVVLATYREKVLWRHYHIWRHVIRAYFLLPVIILAFQVPPLYLWTDTHYKLMGVIGMYNLQDSHVMTFNFAHVLLFWSLVLQRRVFSEFYYGTILLGLSQQQSVRNVRHRKLVKQLKEEGEAESYLVKARDECLATQLSSVRGARDSIFTLAKAEAPAEEELGVTSATESLEATGQTVLSVDSTTKPAAKRAPENAGDVEVKAGDGSVNSTEEDDDQKDRTKGSKEDEGVGWSKPRKSKKQSRAAEKEADKKKPSESPAAAEGEDSYVSYHQQHATVEQDIVDIASEGSAEEEEGKCEKFKKFCVSCTKSLVTWLAKWSFSKEEPPEEYPLFYRVVLAGIAALERQTAFICAAVAYANFAASGTLWDAVPCITLVAIASVQVPWAPLLLYRVTSIFVLVGIVIKVVLILVARILGEGGLNEGLRNFFTLVFTPVLTDATDFQLLMDFLSFLMIVVHIELSVRNGVYHTHEPEKIDPFAATTASGDAIEVIASIARDRREIGDNEEEGEQGENSALLDGEPRRSSQTGSGSTLGDTLHIVSTKTGAGAKLGLFKRFLKNLAYTQGMGKDFYSPIFILDFVAILIFVFGYYSLSNNQRGSIQRSLSNNMLPGPLVLIIFASLLFMIADRAIYTTRNMVAKFLHHTLQVLGVYIGYAIWRFEVQGVDLGAAVAYLAIRTCSFYLSARQIRGGYSKIRNHDPMTPYPESTVRNLVYLVYRAIPLLYELRTLIDWTFVPTQLTLNNWLLVEDLIDIVYNRRVNKDSKRYYKHDKWGKRLKRPMQFVQGGLRIAAIVFAIMFPLLFYSTFNPNQQPNLVSKLDVSLSFGDTATFYQSSTFAGSGTTLAALPENTDSNFVDAFLPVWLARTRPYLGSYDITSSTYDSQLLSLSKCSAELWVASPAATRGLVEQINDSLYNGTQFKIYIDVQATRSGGVSKSSSSTTMQSFHREYIADPFALSLLQTSFNFSMNTTTPSRPPRNASEDDSSLFPEIIVPLRNFYTPFIFNEPTSIQSFYMMTNDPLLDSQDCSVVLRTEFDYQLATWVQYWCFRCEPLFTSGNVPNQNTTAFPESSCVFDNERCEDYNFETNRPKFNPLTAVQMYFVVFSAHIPTELKFLGNIGIIAIYTGFVLAFGKVIRGMFSGGSVNITLKAMADPMPVDQVISYIQLARMQEDYQLEALIYHELVLLIRSPETLLELTGKGNP